MFNVTRDITYLPPLKRMKYFYWLNYEINIDYREK